MESVRILAMCKVLGLRTTWLMMILGSVLIANGCIRRAQPWVPEPIHTPPKPGTGEFNALWDHIDLNGFPEDPYWAAQATPYPGSLPPLHGEKYDERCVQEPYLLASQVAAGKEACTAQATVIDKPESFPDILCFLEPGSEVHGHVNWTVASATGYISWLNLADDWDYNFRFIPAQQSSPPQQDRGLTTNNNQVGNGDPAHYIELEFASSEVSDNFHTPWWQGLAKLVDPLQLSEFEKYIHPANANQDPVAVVTGLFGLDCEHDCRSEFHPVYVLAVQVNEDPTDNTWAIFARNWGDEGFCSSLNHELHLSQNKIGVLLPWLGATGMNAKIDQAFPNTPLPEASLLQDEQGHGLGALVTFSLPQPSESRVAEAIFHFRWSGGKASQPRNRIVSLSATPEAHHEAVGEQQAELRLRDLKTKSGYTRPKALEIAHPPSVPAKAGPTALKTKKYRLVAQTAQTTALGAAPRQPVECGTSASACPASTAKRARDIAMWKDICAGLKGQYPEDKYPGITKLCTDPRLQ